MNLNPAKFELDDYKKKALSKLKDSRIFITGATGFFGCALLEYFIHFNEKLGLNSHISILTRNINKFTNKFPIFLKKSYFSYIEGDILDFDFPNKKFTHIIHAASEVNTKSSQDDPLHTFDIIVNGTRRILDLAKLSESPRFLLTSSGAIYGKQPETLTHIPETYHGAPDTLEPKNIYGISKRLAEHLCAIYTKQGVQSVIARCFAFVGPYLPLDKEYAIGNFIHDGLFKEKIYVNDGTPFRSYLYESDLAEWLWIMLACGQSQTAYNVGSENKISIRDLAILVKKIFLDYFNKKIDIVESNFKNKTISYYVPSTLKARQELNLKENVGLAQGIYETIYSHMSKAKTLNLK